MAYNPNSYFNYEAGRGSIYSSPPKSKPKNANQQAAKSMGSAGIGGLGGKPTTTAAQKIQDNFREQTQKDSGSTYDEIALPTEAEVDKGIKKGLGSPDKSDDDNKDQTPLSRIKSTFDSVSEMMGLGKPEKPKRAAYTPEKIYSTAAFRARSNDPIDLDAQNRRINAAVDFGNRAPMAYLPVGGTYDEITKQRGADERSQQKMAESINATIEQLYAANDPARQFYQSGVPMDQRIFEPELGYDEIALPSEATVDKKIKGLGARPDVTVTELDATTPTTLTTAQRTALSDMGSDIARTNLQNITNAQGNYSQTALTNALDKGIRNKIKKALLKGSSQTEVGEAGPVTEAGYGINNLAGFTGQWRNRSIAAGLLDAEGNVTQLARNLNSQNRLSETIFNVQYADRMGNGDIASGDGSTYKGRGLVQITGKGTYQAVEDILESNGINIDLVDNPELANDTRYALPIALAYLEYAGLDETAAANSSAKDLNNRVNSGADAGTAEERWENVVSNLSGDEATRMENRNEYAAQRTVGTTIDGAIGPNSRAAMTAWLTERNITIPPNATDIDLVVLVNENS